MLRKLKVQWELIILGIGLIFFSIMGLRDFSGKVINLNTMSESQCTAKTLTKGEVNASYGYYCERTWTHWFISTKYRFYLIPFGEDQEKLIGIKVPEKFFDKFEKLTDQTINYDFGTTSTKPAAIGQYQGKIYKTSSKLKGYLSDYLGGTALEERCVPYYIDYETKDDFINMMTIGLISLIAGIGILIYRTVHAKRLEEHTSRLQSINASVNHNTGQDIYSNTYTQTLNIPYGEKNKNINHNPYQGSDLHKDTLSEKEKKMNIFEDD